MSAQQPAPVAIGDNVPEAFQRWANEHGFDGAVRLSEARDAFGRAKYGQPLMTGDGRRTDIDALDELGDLLHYLFKAKMNGDAVGRVLRLLPALEALASEC